MIIGEAQLGPSAAGLPSPHLPFLLCVYKQEKGQDRVFKEHHLHLLQAMRQKRHSFGVKTIKGSITDKYTVL